MKLEEEKKRKNHLEHLVHPTSKEQLHSAMAASLQERCHLIVVSYFTLGGIEILRIQKHLRQVRVQRPRSKSRTVVVR